jgi:hypothetical protein
LEINFNIILPTIGDSKIFPHVEVCGSALNKLYKIMVAENCTPFGYYAASSGNSCQRFGTTYRSHFQGGFPERLARNHHYSLRNNPEERSSHLLGGGSLKASSNACKQSSTYFEVLELKGYGM